MATDDNEPHTLAGAYVLDAVNDDERARFAAHLAGCEQCRAEIRELAEATARLGQAAAVDPRAELKRVTMLAASRLSQDAPLTGRADAQTRWSRRLRAASGGLLPRLALVTTAVAAAVVIVLGLVMHDQVRQLHDWKRQSHLIAVVLNAPDKVMMTARVRTGGEATVVMSHRAHAVVFTAHGLAALPAAQGYELWLMAPTGDRSAGLLRASADGMAGPAVLSGLGTGDMIGLTIEPASGSHRPTSVPIVLIRV